MKSLNKAGEEHVAILKAIQEGIREVLGDGDGACGDLHAGCESKATTVDSANKIKLSLSRAGFKIVKVK